MGLIPNSSESENSDDGLILLKELDLRDIRDILGLEIETFVKHEPEIETFEEEDECEEYEVKIRLKVEDLKDIPVHEIPKNICKSPLVCQIMGLDEGFVYIEIPDFNYMQNNIIGLEEMNQVYNNLDLTAMTDNDVKRGDILVGKVVVHSDGVNLVKYIRVQVLDVFPIEEKALVVDFDLQETHKLDFNILFKMIEYFNTIPPRTVKCTFDGLEEFESCGVPSEVAYACASAGGKYMYVRFVDTSAIPKVILYNSEAESITGCWSFNQDILEAIKNWNRHPLDLVNSMVLTEVLVTSASSYGVIFIQFQSKLMNFLSNLQPKKVLDTPEISENIKKEVLELWEKGHRSYVTKSDGKYRRVIASERSSPMPEVNIIFIDYGIMNFCEVSNLIPTTYFSDILNDIPQQGFLAILKIPDYAKSQILSPNSISLITTSADVQIVIEEPHNLDEPSVLPVVSAWFSQGKFYTGPTDKPPTSPTSSRSSSPTLLVCSTPENNDSCQELVFSYVKHKLPLDMSLWTGPGCHFKCSFDKMTTKFYRNHGMELSYQPASLD